MGALQISLEGASTPTIGAPFRTPRPSCTLTRPASQIRKSQASDGKAASTLIGKDWDLVQLAIAGNADAQERLFKKYTPRLYRTVFALLGNREDAEDAVQESWYKAYANLDSFEGRAAFSTWLTRIAINSALMLLRRKSVRVEACLNDFLDNHSEPFFDGTEPPNPEKIFVARELNALIEDQIRELPPRVQAAFRLRKIEEFSITEAAQALGIRETALKSQVSRARRKVARGIRKLLSTRLVRTPYMAAVCNRG
jgi:RNA polymerase sigma-70 factor (ECF subfamily)